MKQDVAHKEPSSSGTVLGCARMPVPVPGDTVVIPRIRELLKSRIDPSRRNVIRLARLQLFACNPRERAQP